MATADQRGARVGEDGCHRRGRLTELGPRTGCRHQQRGLLDGGERGGVGLQPPLALQLGQDRRAVLGQDPPKLLRERVPRTVPEHFADERLGNHVDTRLRCHLAQAVGQRIHPFGCRGREFARRIALEHDQRPHPVGIAQRKLDRHRAAVAAADDHRRSGRQRVEQGGRVVGMLGNAGAVVGFRTLTARAAATVVGDHAPDSGQLPDRVAPHQCRAAGPVNAKDGGAVPCS